MVEALSLFAAAVSVAALLIALMAYEKASGAQRSPDRAPHGKPPLGAEGKAKPAAQPDITERRRQAVMKREHDNFMNYDGKPQAPIDPNTILEE